MNEFVKEVWVKNSVDAFNKNTAQILLTKLHESNNEANVSSDIAADYEKLVRNVIDRVQIETSMKYFTSVIPINGSAGVVPVSTNKYIGLKSANVNFNDVISIFVVDDETLFQVNYNVKGETSNARGTVLYVEKEKILVKTTDGTFVVGEVLDRVETVVGEDVGTGDDTTTTYTLANSPVDPESETIYLDDVAQTRDVDYTIDNSTGEVTFTTAPASGVIITADYNYLVALTSIKTKFTNTVGVGGILEDYSGDYDTENGEKLKDTDTNAIAHGVKKINVTPKTQKIFTGYTEEYIYDYYRLYGKQGKQKVENSLANFIRLEAESRVITYMKSIATIQPDLVLSNSYGVNVGLDKVYIDILSRINFMKGRIGTNTGLNGKFSIIGSSNVIAALNTLKVIRPVGDKNSKLAGVLNDGSYVIEDPYSLTDYVMVVMLGFEDEDNSAVIFNPYLIDFVIATNPKTLQKELAIISRYDINRSPLDAGETKTEMIEYSAVDFSSLTNGL